MYILSNLLLDEQYRDIQKEFSETWNAFLRRIHVVKFFDEKGIKDYKSVEEYLLSFKPCEVSPWDKEFKTKYKQEMLDLERGK